MNVCIGKLTNKLKINLGFSLKVTQEKYRKYKNQFYGNYQKAFSLEICPFVRNAFGSMFNVFEDRLRQLQITIMCKRITSTVLLQFRVRYGSKHKVWGTLRDKFGSLLVVSSFYNSIYL